MRQTALTKRRRNGDANKLAPQDRAAHNWFRFVLSFPPHLVRDYLAKFHIQAGHCVLDPFCGTGTTVVECKKQGIASVGVEANPMADYHCGWRVSESATHAPRAGRLYQWRTEQCKK